MKQEDIYGIIFKRSVDKKGRFILPVFCNPEENDKVMIYDEGNCIRIYEKEAFLKFVNSLRNNDSMEVSEEITAFTIGEVSVDNYNRITLTSDLMEKYNFYDGVALKGRDQYFRVWNCQDFEKYQEEQGKKRALSRKV